MKASCSPFSLVRSSYSSLPSALAMAAPSFSDISELPITVQFCTLPAAPVRRQSAIIQEIARIPHVSHTHCNFTSDAALSGHRKPDCSLISCTRPRTASGNRIAAAHPPVSEGPPPEMSEGSAPLTASEAHPPSGTSSPSACSCRSQAGQARSHKQYPLRRGEVVPLALDAPNANTVRHSHWGHLLRPCPDCTKRISRSSFPSSPSFISPPGRTAPRPLRPPCGSGGAWPR